MNKLSVLLLIASFVLFGFAAMEKRKASLLSNHKMVQVGIVVSDVEKSAKAWANFLGLEEVPKINTSINSELNPTQFNGNPSEAKVKMAFFKFDNIMLELLEPVGDSSTWSEFLETKGEGIHHIAFDVDDMDVSVKKMEQEGINLIQHGGWNTGEYSYLDAGDMGLIIELLEHYNK